MKGLFNGARFPPGGFDLRQPLTWEGRGITGLGFTLEYARDAARGR
jgi:hypothetical protein